MLLVKNNNCSTRMEKSKVDSKQVFCEWASAKDPKSGRVYYYNIRTKETIWNKPMDLASSAEEREEMLKKRADTLAFFHEMERNIKIKFTNYQNQNVHLTLSSSSSSSSSSNTSSISCNTISGHDDDNQNIQLCQHNQQMNQYFDFLSSSSPFLLDTHHYFNTPPNCSTNIAVAAPPTHIYSVTSLDDGMMSETIKRLDGAAPSNSNILNDNDDCGYDFIRKMIEQKRNTFSSSSSSTSSLTPPLFQAENGAGKGEVEIKEQEPLLNFNKLKRRNSTGTIYVGSTMSVQDNDATIKCVCVVIRTHMIDTANENIECQPEYDIFKDIHTSTSSSSFSHHNPTSSYSPDKQMVPSLSTVKDFFNLVFKKSKIENECIIIALIYCERLVRVTKGKLVIRYDNWRSILFASLIMASKVWDDLSMWNVDFSQVSSSFDLQRINALELAILSELKYTIRVSASEYAKYYFHLRYMMAKLGYTSSLGNDLTNRSNSSTNNDTDNNMGYGNSSSYGTTNNNNTNCNTGYSQPLNMMQARKLQIGTEKYARSYETVLQGRRPRSKTVADLNLCDVDDDSGCHNSSNSNNNSRGNSVEYDSDESTSNNNNDSNNSDERKLKRLFTTEEQSYQQQHQQQNQQQFSLSRSSSGSSTHSNNTSSTLNNFNIYKRNYSNRISSGRSGDSKTLLCLEQLIHENHIDADGQEHTSPRKKNQNINNVCSDSSSNSIYTK